ncbi:adenine phosphoribosyltransferase 1-like isoform X3 [Salvia miltiorrhiza]|uniref:adenine phosphoribosyltransferase 1-like isoform X3 n=1 Tax=Salvia miltiorrhiza TaxID=226208 RepID=UPI0025AD40E5|nr:adenine phosphoribosyltransferase 1-like isoform X3 [Salvia miltiorrhiza]
MYALSQAQPSPLKIHEAKIVSSLRTAISLKSDFFSPNTAAAAVTTTARRRSSTSDPQIYVRSSGGATLPERRRLSGAAMATSNVDGTDDRIARIASTIRVIPDFPKPGIMFQDITTLLLDHKAFKDTIDLFVERYKDQNISVIAGEVISEEYSLEYGTDTMEMHVGAVQPGERAVIVDDLIATGGTLNAAIRLLGRVGVTVVECACVIELKELKVYITPLQTKVTCIFIPFALLRCLPN